MINSINITGYKSFASQEIPLRAVTLLCGLNNSGKSSILQALRMFCNSADGLDPMLSGLGSVDELRSKFVLPTQTIEFECTFDDNSRSSLILRTTDYDRATRAPVTIFLSAERFGPRTLLPIANGYRKYPSIGENGEHVIGFLEALRDWIVPDSLHHPQSQGKTLDYEVAAWLSEIAPGTELFFEVDRKTDTSRLQFNSFRATNTGFGLSYSLPIIAAILGASAQKTEVSGASGWDENWDESRRQRGMLIVIENPEAHLHPSAQTAIGRLIAKGGLAGLQIVVETQSEHIMDGVRLEAREHADGHKSIAFNYLSRAEDGTSKLDIPELTESGKLSHWPNGFFDQALKNKIQLSK